MSGHALGLFFLVLGTTGIVNAIYINQGNRWNGKADSHWHKPSHKKWNYRIQLQPPNFIHNHHPYLDEINKPLHHQISMKYKFQPKLPFNTDHDFHNLWSKHSKSSIFRLSELEENSDENLVSSNTYSSGKNSFNSVQHKNGIEDDIYNDINKKEIKQKKLGTVLAEMASNNYEKPTLPDINFNYEFLSMPMETSISKLNLQLNGMQTDSTVKISSEFNTDSMTSESLLGLETSKMLLQNDETNEKGSSTSHLEHGISESEKLFSTEDQHTFSKETSYKNKNSQIISSLNPSSFKKTESDSYPTDTSRSISFESSSDTSVSYSTTSNTEEKDNYSTVHSSTSSVEIQSTERKESEIESTIPHDSIPSKISEDSFDSFISKTTEENTNDFFSTTSKNLIGENSAVTSTTEETLNDIFTFKLTTSTGEDSLVTLTNADTEETADISKTKLTMSTDKKSVVSLAITKETTNDISSTKPTISTDKELLIALSSIISDETTTEVSSTKSISSTSKYSLVLSKSTITEDTNDFSSTHPTISEKEPISEVIPQDHVIKISSIRTVRVIISTMFLVIALISITILAVYIFQIKRKAVKYDQVLLLP